MYLLYLLMLTCNKEQPNENTPHKSEVLSLVTLRFSVYKVIVQEILRWNEELTGIDLTYFNIFDTIRA